MLASFDFESSLVLARFASTAIHAISLFLVWATIKSNIEISLPDNPSEDKRSELETYTDVSLANTD